MADKIKRSVEYNITANDKASKEFQNIHESASKNLGGVGSIAAIAGTALIGFGVIAGTASLAVGGFALKASDDLEKGMMKYETLLGSTEEAQTRMLELTDFASTTPFQLDEIINADVMLQGFGIRSEKTLETIGNAAAISGSGFKDLSLIMGQLSQDKSLENIRQLVDRGVVSFNELSEAGIEFAEDRSIINSVEETYATVTEIMENKFAGGMDKLSNTMSGKISTLKDTFTLAMAGFAEESGLTDFAKDFLDFAIDKLPSALETAKESFSEISSIVQEFTAPFIDNIPQIIENVKELFEENKATILNTFDDIKDVFITTFEIASSTVQIFKDIWDNDFLGIQTSIKTNIASLTYWGTVTLQVFGGIVDTIAILAENYEFYWNSMKLTVFEFVNDTVDVIEGWADTILTPINAVRSVMGKSDITADFSGAKIDTTYEKAYVAQFAPEETISEAWEKRMVTVSNAAKTYVQSLKKIEQNQQSIEDKKEAEKQVVINNYYNNQLNDNLTVDKMISRADSQQRSALQSYGINVI